MLHNTNRAVCDKVASRVTYRALLLYTGDEDDVPSSSSTASRLNELGSG